MTDTTQPEPVKQQQTKPPKTVNDDQKQEEQQPCDNEPTDYEQETSGKRRIGRWYLGATLGKGGYSWVKKGTDRKNGRMVALKFMDRRLNDQQVWKKSQIKQVKTEIEALRKIRHPNIVRLLAYNLHAQYPDRNGTSRDVILLVLEYAAGGELFDILYYTNKLQPIMARTYFQQLILAVQACHKSGIIHRDVKPQNLLLDKNYNLKLTDFGLAKILKNSADIYSDEYRMNSWHVGTRGYQAPEILAREPYTKAMDVFAMGVVLFILLAGYPPFEHAKDTDRWYRYITSKDYKTFWKSHRGCGIEPQATDIITRMINADPKKRITIKDMRHHPWVCGEVLKGTELSQVLNLRHEKMEKKRHKDPVKQGILYGSSKKRPIIPAFDCRLSAHNIRANAKPPTISENDCISCYNDFYTSYTAYEALQSIAFTVTSHQMEGELISPYENVSESNDSNIENKSVLKASVTIPMTNLQLENNPQIPSPTTSMDVTPIPTEVRSDSSTNNVSALSLKKNCYEIDEEKIIKEIDIFNFALAFKVCVHDLDDPQFRNEIVHIYVCIVYDPVKNMNVIKFKHIQMFTPFSDIKLQREMKTRNVKSFRIVLAELTAIDNRLFCGLSLDNNNNGGKGGESEDRDIQKLYEECFPANSGGVVNCGGKIKK